MENSVIYMYVEEGEKNLASHTKKRQRLDQSFTRAYCGVIAISALL